MEAHTINMPPKRITDLVGLKNKGANVICKAAFEILPVDFKHRNNPFKAHIFLCRYSGRIDKQEYTFRKCYARGCPNNLCPHVSQAVMIANRYLQRDYRRLEQSGIEFEKKLFTLEDMVVKYDAAHKEYGAVMAIHDYINLAREGNDVSIEMNFEYVPAVEHFAGHKNAQVFLMANFTITSLGQTSHIERCLACYPAEPESDKNQAMEIANSRLDILFGQFDEAAIKYEKQYFKEGSLNE